MPFQYVTSNIKPIVHQDSMEGRDWIVAPAQMITEGVHNGSGGPIFYPAEELAKIPGAWNHKPVVVYHPEVNGEFISACSPDQINIRKVGVLFNTKWDSDTKKLATETWLDPARIAAVDNRLAEAIENNEMMEVSTGLFMDLEETEGEWNGQPYTNVARNLQPDHLALLPDQKGACSIEDGAGFLRLNQEGEKFDIKLVGPKTELLWINKNKGIRAFMNKANGKEYVISSYAFLFDEDKWDESKAKEWVKKNKGVTNINTLVMNELSHDDVRSLLYGVLRGDGNNEELEAWIDVVYDNDFIYERDGKLYKQNYVIDKGQVSLEGLPKLVEKQVTYKEVTVLAANKKNSSKSKGNIMDKKKTVDALIKNERTTWKEEDRETLMALEDVVLTNMLEPVTKLSEELTEAVKVNTDKTDKEKEEAKKVADKKVADNKKTDDTPKVKTVEEYVAEAPPEVRESLQMSMNTMNAEKTRLVNVILANAKNTFTEDYLKTKSVDELTGIANLAAPKRDANDPIPMFQGQGEVVNQDDMPEPLELPVMNFDKK